MSLLHAVGGDELLKKNKQTNFTQQSCRSLGLLTLSRRPEGLKTKPYWQLPYARHSPAELIFQTFFANNRLARGAQNARRIRVVFHERPPIPTELNQN
jgi:hypothetical protein